MYITGNLLKRLKATKLCHYSWSRNISEETFARLGYTEKAYGMNKEQRTTGGYTISDNKRRNSL